jgi:hypothetical protein
VRLHLDYRRKGLLWYSTYRVQFSAEYVVPNPTPEARDIHFPFAFPAVGAIYDNFRLSVGGKELNRPDLVNNQLNIPIRIPGGGSQTLEIGYESQGMDNWGCTFGQDVSQIRNFELVIRTDFDRVDFPIYTISPTEKRSSGQGWELIYRFKNLLAGVRIGVVLPAKLNPGPWVARVTRSAPVSLFHFFFLVVIVTALRSIKLHPMHYFFVGRSFFSFHLLLAYLADHISILAAFLISSAVSIFLVISYMRVVVGPRFAFREIGISQFIYLVVFSYTFFFEGSTGLAVTLLCIATLFVVMQATARLNWEPVFK